MTGPYTEWHLLGGSFGALNLSRRLILVRAPGRSGNMETAGRVSGGELNAALTKALVGIQTKHLDRGLANAVSFYRGNVVAAVMHDVLTTAEKVLAQNGSQRDISEFRVLPASDGSRTSAVRSNG